MGLGYVGLPLAVEFSKHFEVIGFDISSKRVNDLMLGIDVTESYSETELLGLNCITYTNDSNLISDCNAYIVTVPTPIDKHKVPDLSLLENATNIIAKYIKSGDMVIYESTVYPGVTKRLVNDILSRNNNSIPISELTIGYSPERINPGDREHTLKNITKLVGCDDFLGRNKIKELYQSIIDAGVVTCESIEIAEAAKIIENIQRDVNIALMNELKIIFDKMNIDFEKVLSAAATKWNFLNFKPGLVGGHCIGVDPYYLAYLAQSLNYNPEMILSGRRINDSMAEYLAKKFVKDLTNRGLDLTNCKVLVLGVAFKPDCGDVRNTKVLDLIVELNSYGIEIDVFDPIVEFEEHLSFHGFNYIENEEALDLKKYDVLLSAVRHSCIIDLLAKLKQMEIDFLVYDLINGFITQNN